MESSPHVAMGQCTVNFHSAAPYEPPLYLFPELLPKVRVEIDAETAAPKQPLPRVHAPDTTTNMVDFASSQWSLFAVNDPLAAVVSPPSSSTGGRKGARQLTPADEVASLIIQGSFSPLHLNASVLDPENGFSSKRLTDSLVKLANMLGERALLKSSRSMLGRPLTESELLDEAQRIRKAVLTKYFVHLLAWQRLEELLAIDEPHTPISVNQLKSTTMKGELDSDDAKQQQRPSADPWQSEYESCDVSVEEANAERKIEWCQLMEAAVARSHRANMSSWKTQHSVGQQTEEDLRRRTAGVSQTVSPYADVSKVPSNRTLQDDVRRVFQQVAASYDPFKNVVVSTPSEHVAGWRITIRSQLCEGTSLETTQVLLRDTAGAFLNLGREEGFSASQKTFVHLGLGSRTAAPKRIAGHHCTLSVIEKGRLIITACGANGVRVLGKRHLLAGDSWATSMDDIQPNRPIIVALVADVSLEINYQHGADNSEVTQSDTLKVECAKVEADPDE